MLDSSARTETLRELAKNQHRHPTFTDDTKDLAQGKDSEEATFLPHENGLFLFFRINIPTKMFI